MAIGEQFHELTHDAGYTATEHGGSFARSNEPNLGPSRIQGAQGRAGGFELGRCRLEATSGERKKLCQKVRAERRARRHQSGCAWGPAKAVADCFKYRNKIGVDVAVEALRDLLAKSRRATIDELWRHAAVDRVQTVIRPYLEGLTVSGRKALLRQ